MSWVVDSAYVMAFLGSARVKASLSRWWLLFHLLMSVWESMTVGSWKENGGNLCAWGACTRWRANDFFILSTILTLNPLLHSYTHSTSITHPCPGPNRVHKELCPLQSGYCEAQACEICLWSCLGMRDYSGFRLWCPKLYVHTLADGEIHGEQQTRCLVQFQHSTAMRGPNTV